MKFKEWINEAESWQLQPTNPAMQQPVPSTSNATQQTAVNGREPPMIPGGDPKIVGVVNDLQQKHKDLRNILMTIRNSAAFKPNSQYRQAFEKHMQTGIDSIGRAHMVLGPAKFGG